MMTEKGAGYRTSDLLALTDICAELGEFAVNDTPL
jgi:hypothetical protein